MRIAPLPYNIPRVRIVIGDKYSFKGEEPENNSPIIGAINHKARAG
jgi:hypothetical protein